MYTCVFSVWLCCFCCVFPPMGKTCLMGEDFPHIVSLPMYEKTPHRWEDFPYGNAFQTPGETRTGKILDLGCCTCAGHVGAFPGLPTVQVWHSEILDCFTNQAFQ